MMITVKFELDSITDWLQLVFTFFGGLYALWLLREANREKRNQYVLEILNRLYNDNEIRLLIYSVDSNRDLDEIKYRGNLEKEADKTIKYFDYIGYLIKEKQLTISDIRPFRYEINRVLSNEFIKDYIVWLKEIGVPLEYLSYLNDIKNSIKK